MRKLPPLSYPSTSAIGSETMICVPTHLIPFFRIFFGAMQERGTWKTREDWIKGYQAFAAIEEQLMACTGIQVLIDEQRRLYRLLDSALNGQLYTATIGGNINGGGGSWGGGGGGGGGFGGVNGGGGSWGADQQGNYTPVPNSPTGEYYFISPPISPAPPNATLAPPPAPGLRARIERLLALNENMTSGKIYPITAQNPTDPALTNTHGVRAVLELMQGDINAGWFGIGGQKATIADVVNALRVGSDAEKDSIVDVIEQLTGVGANAASIFSAVKGLFIDTVDLASEGAMLGVLVASTLANAAIAAQQQLDSIAMLAKLDLLLAALRGPTVPADNILRALRGDVAADENRNIVTLLN